jgi:hypothetical protein
MLIDLTSIRRLAPNMPSPSGTLEATRTGVRNRFISLQGQRVVGSFSAEGGRPVFGKINFPGVRCARIRRLDFCRTEKKPHLPKSGGTRIHQTLAGLARKSGCGQNLPKGSTSDGILKNACRSVSSPSGIFIMTHPTLEFV